MGRGTPLIGRGNRVSTAPAPEVIIIGSGAGGAAAAYRLVSAGVRVLMLEKGAELPHDGSTLDPVKVVTDGKFLSKEIWLDGRGHSIRPEEHFNVGGKTKWYGAAVLRYSVEEFEADAAYAANGWPISRADLVPYYDEAERLLGARTFDCEPGLKRILDGLSAADSEWVSAPMPMALSPEILHHSREATHFDGFASVLNLKGDAESSFIKAIAGNPNFSLRTGAQVDELLPAATDRSRIGGIKLAGGEELRAPVVMLAAGTLHSPRLLQRYMQGDTSLRRLEAVGRNLKKHVLTALVAVSLREQSDILRKTMITTHAQYPHSSVQPLGFDSQLIAALVPKFVPRFLAGALGKRAYGFFLQTEDGAHADNRVFDRGSQRVMDYDAARIPASQREHTAFTHAFQRTLLRAGMLSFTQRVGLTGTAHVSGTLAAGTDAATSVVDHRGAVFGIEGLYVVDGSVLPRSSRVNPSLTIYAWALRVGHLLAGSIVQKRG
jgi:choline dehydrogenase-like flavoprotein